MVAFLIIEAVPEGFAQAGAHLLAGQPYEKEPVGPIVKNRDRAPALGLCFRLVNHCDPPWSIGAYLFPDDPYPV